MSKPDNSRLQEIYDDILGRAPEHDIEPSLDRVQAVLDILGDPQKNYRIIHITGTNGKTSTARMCESLVRASGLRVGLFTSPHLSSMNERIQIDGNPISDEQFIAIYEDIVPYLEMVDQKSLAEGGPRLSFFEVLTVMAYAAFADAPVDIAAIE
ncbi:MAG: dihydrofolate synthase, partial [Cellulomonadaceae bacterium]|nr:dihydrofolate synthase [Cellulomonadaceae bacterium]